MCIFFGCDFMENVQITAQRIKELCDKHNVSINKMLQECNAGTRTYHNILSGSIPSADKILKIAEFFGVSTDYLLGKTDIPVFATPEQTDNFTEESADLTPEERDKIIEYMKFLKSQREEKGETK